tara:strand:- start:1046 stop:1381 length:336 start_codon:yes stop_codon:yes gene_type:complete
LSERVTDSQQVNLLQLLLNRAEHLEKTIDERRKQTLQWEEILEHCWYKGFKNHEEGAMDFALYHGGRVNGAYQRYKAAIKDHCDSVCGAYQCPGIERCDISKETLHDLFHD